MLSRMTLAAAIAFCAVAAAQAGEIKLHTWPTKLNVGRGWEIVTIPVTMDGEVYFNVTGSTLKLADVGSGTYEGSTNLRVSCNCGVVLTCSIVPNGAVPGEYSCSLASSTVDPPGGTVKLSVRLTNAHFETHTPGSNVQVATVQITVTTVP
jgi:hypothetical protein